MPVLPHHWSSSSPGLLTEAAYSSPSSVYACYARCEAAQLDPGYELYEESNRIDDYLLIVSSFRGTLPLKKTGIFLL